MGYFEKIRDAKPGEMEKILGGASGGIIHFGRKPKTTSAKSSEEPKKTEPQEGSE